LFLQQAKVFEDEQQIEKFELRIPVIGFCSRPVTGGGLLSLGAILLSTSIKDLCNDPI